MIHGCVEAESVREHDRTSLQRAAGGRGDGGGGRYGGFIGSHNAGRTSIQEKMAKQDEATRQALRQAQHRHRCQCSGLLGEIRPLLRSRAQRS